MQHLLPTVNDEFMMIDGNFVLRTSVGFITKVKNLNKAESWNDDLLDQRRSAFEEFNDEINYRNY